MIEEGYEEFDVNEHSMWITKNGEKIEKLGYKTLNKRILKVQQNKES